VREAQRDPPDIVSVNHNHLASLGSPR